MGHFFESNNPHLNNPHLNNPHRNNPHRGEQGLICCIVCRTVLY